MTQVRIDRLSATATGWPEPDQVPAMLHRVAADRLQDALRSSPLPAGDWCVQRVDLAVELDPERPLSALETDWADRIVTALRLSLRDGSANVVRYERPEAAVDDLLAGLALGRVERAWAWRQVGLLPCGGPEPGSDPVGLCLRVLADLPHGRPAALVRLVAGVGVPAVHRLLGRAGWVRLAVLVAAEAGAAWAPAGREWAELAGVDGHADQGPGPRAPATEPARRDSLDALAAAIVSTGGLAAALRASALRVDQATVQAWAVLAIGAADPTLLPSPTHGLLALVDAVADRLRPTVGPGLATAPSVRRSPSKSPGGTRTPDAPHDAGTHRSRSEAEPDPEIGSDRPGELRRTDATPEVSPGSQPAPPAEPTPDYLEGKASRWGGLLFLLNSAALAGLPDLLDEPPFLARPAPWVMRRLGLAMLPLHPDDPALRAFAGTGSDASQTPPDEAEQRAVDACARRWVTRTARLLRADDQDARTAAEVVQGLAARSATIAQEPGWVEVQLRLDQVDVRVRRVGLDLDPGWVWWLGHVVRFRYE